MPLPPTALTLNRGCNCRAILYKINIPPSPPPPTKSPSNDSHRPLQRLPPRHRLHPPNLDLRARSNDVRLPPPCAFPSARKVATNDGPWRPVMEVLHPDNAQQPSATTTEGSTLRFYGSSPDRTRAFCGNCGTNLTYTIVPMPHGLPELVDTVLGTVDREVLELRALSPERHCWWEKGIPWVQDMVGGGPEISKHPTFKVNEIVG